MVKKIFIMFKVVVIFNLLICLVNGSWTATFICLFNFLLLFVADYVQKKMKYTNFLQLLIYLFLIGSLVGGEVYNLYSKIWYFDIILHTFSSFIISWLFIDIVKLFGCKFNKFLLLICIFSFAMMIAGLWEITEFSIDRIFSRDMQKDTIIKEINSVLLSDGGIVNINVNHMIIGNYNIDGYLDIGLYDTIEDILCAVFGSLIFIIFCKNKIKEASLV